MLTPKLSRRTVAIIGGFIIGAVCGHMIDNFYVACLIAFLAISFATLVLGI